MRKTTVSFLFLFVCGWLFAQEKVNLEMINTSEVRVNVVVAGEHGPKAMECLKKAFADVLL